MSFTEKKFVAIHCDECDEQYEPEDGSAYYTDKDDADDDASSTDGNWMETKTTTVRNTGI